MPDFLAESVYLNQKELGSQLTAEFLTSEANTLVISTQLPVERAYPSNIFCNRRTVFQFLAVPMVFSFFSRKAVLSFERPIPSG
jgi:hypothetical protein